VVVVDDNYSVRITEIIKAKDTGYGEGSNLPELLK
jgi:hypothetical protein